MSQKVSQLQQVSSLSSNDLFYISHPISANCYQSNSITFENLLDNIPTSDVDLGDIPALSGNWNSVYTTYNTYSATYMDLSGINSNVQSLKFNTQPTVINPLTGSTYWDANNHTITTVLENGVRLQHGQEVHLYGKNVSNQTLANGQPVAVVQNNGQFTALSSVDITTPAAYGYVGLATQDILPNEFGYVTRVGVVRDINTDHLEEGKPVYVGPDGQLTKIFPTVPNYIINVGMCEYKHQNHGRINVISLIVSRLVDLSDVDGTPLTQNGQIMVWNNDSKYFDPNYNINSYTLLSTYQSTSGVYTTVLNNSAIWSLTAADVNLGDIPALSGNWNNVYTAVSTTSGFWNNASTIVQNNSANWDTVYGTVSSYAKLDGTNMPFTSAAVTGNFIVNTNTLYVDASSNRIGAGTLSPSAKLHITGTSDAVQLKVTANATQTNDVLQILASDGTTVRFAQDTKGYIKILNSTGANNVMILGGTNGVPASQTGNFVTALGDKAGKALTSGASNTFIGYNAGALTSSGGSNIYIGANAGNRQTTGSNILLIDNQDRTSAALELTNALIYGVFNATPANQTLTTNVGTFAVAGGGTAQSTITRGLAVNTGLVAGATGTFNAKGSVDQNLIYTDTTNDRVGIGTSSPTTKLTVAGAVSITSAAAGQSNLNKGLIVNSSSGNTSSDAFQVNDATSFLIKTDPTIRGLGFFATTPIAQPTTGFASATLVSGGGTALTDTDTFDGYTIKQVVRALRLLGVLN
jgi:hypothetical protein